MHRVGIVHSFTTKIKNKILWPTLADLGLFISPLSLFPHTYTRTNHTHTRTHTHTHTHTHRDIKPANLLVNEDSGTAIKLIDLGAAVDLRTGFDLNLKPKPKPQDRNLKTKTKDQNLKPKPKPQDQNLKTYKDLNLKPKPKSQDLNL